MVGCRKPVNMITGGTIDIEIRPGVESGVEYASTGKGFHNVNNRTKGRFVTVVKVKGISVTDPDLARRLRLLQDEINKA